MSTEHLPPAEPLKAPQGDSLPSPDLGRVASARPRLLLDHACPDSFSLLTPGGIIFLLSLPRTLFRVPGEFPLHHGPCEVKIKRSCLGENLLKNSIILSPVSFFPLKSSKAEVGLRIVFKGWKGRQGRTSSGHQGFLQHGLAG